MKKMTVSLAMVAIMTASPVYADTVEGWYVGGSYSFQSISEKRSANASGGVSIFPGRDHEIINVIGGFKFNQYLAAEIVLGRGVSGYGFDYTTTGGSDGRHDHDIQLQYSALVRGFYPLIESLSVTGSVGYSAIDSEYSSGLKTNGYTYDDNDNGLSYSLGLTYSLTEQINAFIEYQVLPDYDRDNFENRERDSTNIGFSYQF